MTQPYLRALTGEDVAAMYAENERLRAALKECSEDLAGEIDARYPLSDGDRPGRDAYPGMQRRYDRDMAPVINARKLLGYGQTAQKEIE